MDNNRTIKKLEECLTASCCGFRTCPYTDIEWDALEESLSTMKSQQAEIERLMKEKADVLKRVQALDIPCVGIMSYEAYMQGVNDAIIEVINIINNPSV